MGNSYNMNAKLTTRYQLDSPGSFILGQIYKTRANQSETYYRILGNKSFEKRIYNFNKHGARSYSTCNLCYVCMSYINLYVITI